jgi:hypothetical protein
MLERGTLASSMQVFIKLDFSRIFSRFSEYGFLFLCWADKTSSTFGFLSGEQQINIYFSQLVIDERDLFWPAVPKYKARPAEGQSKQGHILPW